MIDGMIDKYYYCALCHKFTTDRDNHVNGVVHQNLLTKFKSMFDNGGSIATIVGLDSNVYKAVMEVSTVSEQQERTMSEMELAKQLSKYNPIVDIINMLQINNQSEWNDIIASVEVPT